MAKSGASKGAKKINAFNDGKLDGVNVAQGFVKKVGEKVGVREFVRGAEIIDATETNPLKKYLRLKRMEKHTPLDTGMGGV